LSPEIEEAASSRGVSGKETADVRRPVFKAISSFPPSPYSHIPPILSSHHITTLTTLDFLSSKMLSRSIIAPLAILLAISLAACVSAQPAGGHMCRRDPQKRIGGLNSIQMSSTTAPVASYRSWTSGKDGNTVTIIDKTGLTRLSSGLRTHAIDNRFYIYLAQPGSKDYYLKDYLVDRGESCFIDIDGSRIKDDTKYFMAATKYW
jgi:hypothetical protein